MDLMPSIFGETPTVNSDFSTFSYISGIENDSFLPLFEPEARTANVREWCSIVDDNVKTLNVSSEIATNKANLHLRGVAKHLANTSQESTTWVELKEELIRNFDTDNRYADDIKRWREYTSKRAKTYEEYVIKGCAFFKRVRPEASDSDIIEALITGIYPKFIQFQLLRDTPHSLDQLISILKKYHKYKSDDEDERGSNICENSAKRFRADNCFECNSLGKRTCDCNNLSIGGPSENQTLSNADDTFDDFGWNNTIENVRVEDDFLFKQSDEAERLTLAKFEKRYSPFTNRSTTHVKIGNLTYVCLFDTGADCSLIREKVAKVIPGERKPVDVTFTGLGGNPIGCTQSITTTIEIDNVSIEANLFVVANNKIQFDLLLGYDLLKIPGLTVSLSLGGINVQYDRF